MVPFRVGEEKKEEKNKKFPAVQYKEEIPVVKLFIHY
jgi:hypothetical protein